MSLIFVEYGTFPTQMLESAKPMNGTIVGNWVGSGHIDRAYEDDPLGDDCETLCPIQGEYGDDSEGSGHSEEYGRLPGRSY